MTSTRLRIASLIVAVAATVAAVAAVVAGAGGDDGDQRERVGAPLEFFDGTTGDLSDFAGTPVVINFWASWCPACVAEMPDFGALDREFGGRVAFLGLNMQEISLPAALHLIDETGVGYLMAHDRDGSIFRMFGGIAMPTTVFIDADGSLARVHPGVLFADDLRHIIETELLS